MRPEYRTKLLVLTVLTAALVVFVPLPATAASEEPPSGASEVFQEHETIMLLVELDSEKILYANEAAASFYGYNREELTTMSMQQLVAGASEGALEKALAELGEGNGYFQLGQQLADGETRTVEFYAYTTSLDGVPVLSLIAHDVTQRIQHERVLRFLILLVAIAAVGALVIVLFLLVKLQGETQSLEGANMLLAGFQALWKTFYDADPSYMYLKDSRLSYVFVNRAFAEFSGLPTEQIIGRDDYAIYAPEHAEQYIQSDREVIAQNRLIISTVSWKDRYFRRTKFPVSMPDGTLGVGAYINDVTEEHEQAHLRERTLKHDKLLLEILTRSFCGTQEQLNYALRALLELSGSQFGYIFFYHEETQELVLNAFTPEVPGQCPVEGRLPVYRLADTGIWGEAIRKRAPIIVNGFTRQNSLKKGGPLGLVKLERFMSIPVIIDREIVAAIGFANKQTDYDEGDVAEMTMLMSGVWNAVQRREAAETLAYERNKYYQTLFSIGDGVMVIDRDRNIEFLNAVACKLTGWPLEEARGINYKEVFVLSHEQKGLEVADPIDRVFSTGAIEELGNHAVLTSKTGETYLLEDSAAPIPDETGALAGVVLVFRDVTEKKEQRRKIEYMSFHDVLTGLYNRRFFEEELHRLDTERNLPIAILMGDVNSLKLTNDVFGHASGDELLKKVAEVMQMVCRADDIIARWGGDEFVLLLPKTGAEEAGRIANRIRDEFSAQQVRAIRCSISLGFAVKTDPSDDILQVLSRAEAKMYTEKALARDGTLEQELGALISDLFKKSEQEKQHALRVQDLSRRLGEFMALPKSDLNRLMEAAYLHDIGKVIMAPEYLQNDGVLNAAEMNDIKMHPAIGYRILSSFDVTMELAEAVLAHHERWDGSGYPKALKGERIPLLARILSVVESYDRLIHICGGRAALSHDEALREILAGAGTHFDPGVTAAFAGLFENSGDKL
jgi:diguanylate cyclase (GGDEF)-like protein/PAS domain S-box-containing protein